MGRKRVIIGQSEWGINDENVNDVVAKIKAAMENGTVAELELVDGADRRVTILLNGKAAVAVVLDLDLGPRPTEIPG
jgi:VCBS repeat-containing protein